MLDTFFEILGCLRTTQILPLLLHPGIVASIPKKCKRYEILGYVLQVHAI